MEKGYYYDPKPLILGVMKNEAVSNINQNQKKSLEICFTTLESCKNSLKQILKVAQETHNANYSDFLVERIEDIEYCEHDIELKLKQ